jgi:hypothetical protein
MYAHSSVTRSGRLFLTFVILVIVGGAVYAHNYVGTTYPTLARARVQSPNANVVDLPQPISGTALSLVCFKVRNTSPFDSRITAIGFDLPGTLSGFTLVDSGGFDFQLIEQVSNVPELHDLTLDFALVTGRTFGGGRPNSGLPPSSVLTTFCVAGPFPPMPIERILDRGVLRFQRVGAAGDAGDIAVWENFAGLSRSR